MIINELYEQKAQLEKTVMELCQHFALKNNVGLSLEINITISSLKREGGGVIDSCIETTSLKSKVSNE